MIEDARTDMAEIVSGKDGIVTRATLDAEDIKTKAV